MIKVFFKPTVTIAGGAIPDILMVMPADTMKLAWGEYIIGYSIPCRAEINPDLLDRGHSRDGWFGITATGKLVFFFIDQGGKFYDTTIDGILSYEVRNCPDPERFLNYANACWETNRR